MCLIIFAYKNNPDYPLIIAGNRDEYFDRPTSRLEYWEDAPWILAGRDLKQGGTWLGITTSGRFAALTNYRDAGTGINSSAPSRGHLVSDYLKENYAALQYLEDINKNSSQYNGFNLLIGDASGLYYYSNRESLIRKLKPGIYGLSNHLLDTLWPKVKTAKTAFRKIIGQGRKIDIEAIFEILKDETRPLDENLPDTGVDLEWERLLSSVFIKSPTYGTRSSSVVLFKQTGQVVFTERTFGWSGSKIISKKISRFNFNLMQG